MTRGAPLRFLGGVVAGWTALRVVMLWPTSLPVPLGAAPALAEAPPQAQPRQADPQSKRPSLTVSHPVATAERTAGSEPPAPAGTPQAPVRLAALAFRAPNIVVQMEGAPRVEEAPNVEPRVRSPVVARLTGGSRIAVDSWLVLRPGGGDSLAFGQLGASQGGARLTYALDESRRVALSARLSAPTRGPGREAGLGLDVRPTSLPIHLLLEERFDLDGGASRPAAGLIAGGSAALPGRARLDAYGQGGAVLKRGGFVDGAALVSRPVLERGAAHVELGGGAWGAAQRRAARLDVGPSLAVVAPVGGRAVRLQLDYRARVAGHARPGSGPALTLGGSF